MSAALVSAFYDAGEVFSQVCNILLCRCVSIAMNRRFSCASYSYTDVAVGDSDSLSSPRPRRVSACVTCSFELLWHFACLDTVFQIPIRRVPIMSLLVFYSYTVKFIILSLGYHHSNAPLAQAIDHAGASSLTLTSVARARLGQR